MVEKNLNCFKAVRTRIAKAEEELQIACKTLRRNGWEDTADELSRELRLIRLFTKQGGILDMLQKAPEIDMPEDCGSQFLRASQGVIPCRDA